MHQSFLVLGVGTISQAQMHGSRVLKILTKLRFNARDFGEAKMSQGLRVCRSLRGSSLLRLRLMQAYECIEASSKSWATDEQALELKQK